MPERKADWGDSSSLSLAQIWEKFERLKRIKDEAESWCTVANERNVPWSSSQSIHENVLAPITAELEDLMRIASRTKAKSPHDLRCKALILTCLLRTIDDRRIVDLASSLESDLQSIG